MLEKKPAVEEKQEGALRIWKNVVMISLAFMLHFTAYSGAANLQSSINAEAGLGMASLAAVYAGLIASNVFLPSIVIKWLGCKWAISLSFITYMPYIAAQLYPTFWTLIPAGLLVGFGGGPLWCAKCTYLSAVSEAYHKISGIPAEVLLSRFLGVFFMVFQLHAVWGNLISSLVISSGGNSAAVTAVNASMIPELCGANFLPNTDAGEALQAQPQQKIQMLAGIYLACMAGACIFSAVTVDSMKRYVSSSAKKQQSALAMLASTTKLFIEPNQLLLVMINIFVGLQQAFVGADFTAAFVSCAIGTGSVGYIMMTQGICDAIGCIVTGYLVKITGRFPLLCAALLTHTALFATVLLWRPTVGSEYVMYLIVVFWGVCDSIWLVQINAYYGTLFPGREEAAYANFRLWESVGYIIAYLNSPYLRTSHKTYLLIFTMYTGFAGYVTVEVRKRRERKTSAEITKETGKEMQGRDNAVFSEL